MFSGVSGDVIMCDFVWFDGRRADELVQSDSGAFDPGLGANGAGRRREDIRVWLGPLLSHRANRRQCRKQNAK